MTTRLDRKNTEFLPLNRALNGRRGNPPNPDACPTSWLWEEVWERDSWPVTSQALLCGFVRKQRAQSGGMCSYGNPANVRCLLRVDLAPRVTPPSACGRS